MQFIHTHPYMQSKCKIEKGHVIVDHDQFLKARNMEQAMLIFIKRRDNGEIKSTKTYKTFKDILGL